MKSQVIVIYGMIGVGKLTVAKILTKKTGYKLCHNHLINDTVSSIFERGSEERPKLIEDIADMLYAKALEKHISFITTHAYSHDYISPTGQSDHEYLKKIEKEAEKNNVKAYFIHLIADDNSILNRIINPSRKEYLKLTDQEIMKELLQQHDRKTSADVRNNLTIDTTHLTAEETAEQILNFIQ